jgi:16S rRNA (cytidine1402-2'-O)-methyltransferase
MTTRDIRLYLVPTPIGNLGDITFRAVEILKEVDFILAEDTRTSQNLLRHLEIRKPLYSHHKFNEHKAVQGIVDRLATGEKAALISDAGTPGISDPGFLLVRACITAGLEVECLPGPTALIPALVNSGFPSDRFVFEGFLPLKKGRQTRLRQLAQDERTMILYESPLRLGRTLQNLADEFGSGRLCSVSREISKIHEETVRGTLSELIAWASSKTIKGEIVIVIKGSES